MYLSAENYKLIQSEMLLNSLSGRSVARARV